MRGHRQARRDDGYALMAVLLALCFLVLMLAKAVPSWRTEIQREHEALMIDRAKQYRMAIKRYFHKNGRYPPDLDALVQHDGSGLRYLREKWPDPLNPQGNGAWQFIHYGQAVTAEIVGQPPQQAQKGMGGISAPGLTAASGPTTAGPAGIPGLPSAGASGGPGQAMGAGMTAGGPSSGAAGAGPIIGVASLSKKPAVHEFNGFDTPDHWQFVYNFATDPSLRAGVPGMGGLPGGITPGAKPVPQPSPSGGGGGN